MKSDLDDLMKSRGLDAIFVMGPAQHNPAMYYLTGGAHLTGGDVIKKHGQDPVLFYNPMERDEAAKTGLRSRNLADYNMHELLKKTDGDHLKATILRYRQMFIDYELTSGRIALYGKVEAGSTYAIFSNLDRDFPDLTVVGELTDSALLQAMATKDEAEIEHMRKIGQVTIDVVGKVADLLTSHKAKNGILIKSDGEPLRIGDVKRKINLWLAEQGAENPEGTIFAIGRDAGIPHSSGNPQDLLRLGQTIVFDIFPCESGGGYFYDFTRTWCLGYAPDKVQAIYEDVSEVYQQIMGELEPGIECRKYQDRTCELFEERGHPTVKNQPQTENGYVHSLGHGLGLHVHERPWFGQSATQDDRLDPGVVVTIEPGLYYPDDNLGVRLEDTVWVRPEGNLEILAEYPHDLILPVKQI